jgi:PRC-barrel domain
MANPTYASRLRFLDANDVHDDVVDYDGLDVLAPDGHKIGNLDGFIVDAERGRLYHVVVDSGGWFTSRQFLVPVGHARIAANRRALVVDVSRDALGRFPEFHPERFREFTDADLRTFERRIGAACCPDEPLDDVSVPTWGYDTRRHYAQPEWWRPNTRREHLRPIESRVRPAAASAAAAPMPAAREVHQREHVTARADERDVSPHFEGRAQPGDVLGIETGGERTHMGETADDENKRRQTAERARRE